MAPQGPSGPPTTSTTASSTTPASTPSQPPTSAPPSSSSSPPSSSSGSTSSASSSSSSVSSTSTTPSTSSTPTPTSSSTSLSQFLTTSEGNVVTKTSTFIVGTRPVSSETSSSLPSRASTPFFQNKGAVAGVFTVVGLIAAALIFALITNIIRRRRAKAFDKELQEATREAAAVSAPAFLDDDDDGYGRPGPGSAAYSSGYGASSGERQFSDLSHGTYGQNPMSHTEAYNMRELGPGVGEIYDPYAGTAAAGAAGIGIARARSMKSDQHNSYSAALADGASPYAAFAGPHGGYGANAPPLPGAGAGMGGGDPFEATAAQKNLELLEAAGMGAHLAGAGAASASLSRAQSQHYDQQQGYQYPQYQHPQPGSQRASQNPNEYDAAATANLDRNKSMSSNGHGHEQPLTSASTGATQYYSPGAASPQRASMQSQVQQAYNPLPQQRWSVVNEDPEDAYGGYSAPAGAPAQVGLPNPFSNATSTDGHVKEWDRESRSSYSQEEPRRVLKVANE